jgi:hypothetical protein
MAHPTLTLPLGLDFYPVLSVKDITTKVICK